MKNKNSRCVWFTVLALFAATFSGCDSKGDKEPDAGKVQQIGSELKSLGRRSTGVLGFNLKCKSNGIKLYWVLEVRQTVLGVMGIDGYSGDDAAEVAKRILKEFQSSTKTEGKAGSTPQNKIKIEFMDSNGFTVVAATTDEISSIDADGENAVPLVQGWYYRGIIDLDPSEISRISSYQLRGEFSEGMNGLLREAGVLVEKKRKERKERNN